MQSWDEVRRWRKEQRARLIARRQAIPQDERRRLQPLILDLVAQHFPALSDALLGFYWPIRGEIGPHPLVRHLVERGARAALPVVIEKGQPLEFWAWRPGTPLRRGVWDIPIPAERQVVRPTALLVPLVGFDRRGYRLGYGGGYYDRTLAALDPKPLTALLRQGFRPFFLGAGGWALAAMALWIAILHGSFPLPTAFDPVAWHVHEMLFGFVVAAIAGFLLTAIPNWTGRMPLQGAPLAVLVGVWVAGRLAVGVSAWIGAGVAAVLDLAFLALLLGVVLREILLSLVTLLNVEQAAQV
jgi:5-formyltetrahydrofolate cyclo-ligase